MRHRVPLLSAPRFVLREEKLAAGHARSYLMAKHSALQHSTLLVSS